MTRAGAHPWIGLTAALSGCVLAAGQAAAAPSAGARHASAEECAIIAEVARGQYSNRKGRVPLAPLVHVPGVGSGSASVAKVQGEELGQYYRDYFPELSAAETADLGQTAAGERHEGYTVGCAWGDYGVAFADGAPALTFWRPVIAADRRYAIESSHFDSAALGAGGSDCLLRNGPEGWRVVRCRPRG